MAAAVPRRRIIALLALLYRWAESGWSSPIAAGWALLNSSVVPGPSEAVLVPLGLADPKRAYRLAAWTIVGAMIGSACAYGIGAFSFDRLGAPLLTWIGLSAEQLETIRTLFEARGWLVVVLGTLPMLSTKVVSIAAGAFGLPFGQFLPILFVVRSVRFLIVATLCRFAGARMTRWAERRLGHPMAEARRAGAVPVNGDE